MKFLDALYEVTKEFIRTDVASYLKGIGITGLKAFNDTMGVYIRRHYGITEDDSLLLLTVLWKEYNG